MLQIFQLEGSVEFYEIRKLYKEFVWNYLYTTLRELDIIF